MKKSNLLICAIAVTMLAGIIAGCATTSQTSKVSQSGFLGDYSQLKPGAEGEAQLVYVNPQAKFATYKKIVMDPITVYAADENSQLNKVPQDELKSIVDYLDAAVREKLQSDYAFVNEAGPGTLRLRIAITEAKGANVALNAASSITPAGLALSGMKKAVTGASTGVGKAGVEMELLDAQTNQRLAAAVDERAGSKMSSFSKWQGIQEAYDYWAARLQTRLAELRAK